MQKKSRSKRRINTQGPRVGQCNVCGEVGPLTIDHTPPKGCGRVGHVEAQSLHDRLSTSGERWQHPRRFQSGVSFRSICERCNNLMGRRYDPSLVDMCGQVRAIANSTVHLPDIAVLKVQPQAVARSVLGHLAAQGVDRYLKGPMTEPLRDYLLDTALPLPLPIRIYYWLYPHLEQVLVRDAVRLELTSNAMALFWLMKFFPLAFMVTFDEPPIGLYRLDDLHRFREARFDEQQELYFRLRPLTASAWPEHPGDTGVILYGPQALSARPLSPIRRQ